jgi:hypothetical protein
MILASWIRHQISRPVGFTFMDQMRIAAVLNRRSRLDDITEHTNGVERTRLEKWMVIAQISGGYS